MLKDKKVVIFDMDGTLIDSVGVWNYIDQRLIQAISGGTKVSGEQAQQQRDAVLRIVSKAENSYLEYCRFLGNRYQANVSGERILQLRYTIAREYLTDYIDYKPNAEQVIKKLTEDGMLLAIATTTKKANMDIYRNSNQNIIKKAPLDDYFTRIYTREDVRNIKPHPEVYYKVLQELDVTADQCLVFEDSLIGIEAAGEAGIDVAVIYDQYSDHDRAAINRLAQYWFNDYNEVLAMI